MWRGKGKTKWTGRDRLLVLAWERYEASLCDGCGQEKARSMNPDMDGYYKVAQIECAGCAALEAERKKANDFNPALKEFLFDTRRPDNVPQEWAPNFAALFNDD